MTLDRVRPRLHSPTARLGSLAVADQAVVSGTNFVTALMLAIFCSEAEYGAYVIPFYVLMVSAGILSSFVCRPLNVLGATQNLPDFRRYVTALMVVQGTAGLLVAAGLGLVVAGLAGTVSDTRVVAAFGGLATAVFFVLGREFVRQVLYTRLKPGAALLNDAVYGAGLVAAILLLRHGGGLDARGVFHAMAVVAGAALCLGAVQVRGYVTVEKLDLKAALRRNWDFGKWSVANAVSSAGCGQLVIFVVAAYVGPVAVASLEVTRLLVAPLNVLRTAVTNVAVPRAAQLFSRAGRDGMNPFLYRTIAWLFAAYLVFCTFLLLCPGTLLGLVYGGKYAGVEILVQLWAVVFLGMALRTVPGVGLSAMRRPDLLFKTSALAAVVTIGVACLLVPMAGAAGAMVAMVIGEVLNLAAAAFVYYRPGVDRHPVVRFGT